MPTGLQPWKHLPNSETPFLLTFLPHLPFSLPHIFQALKTPHFSKPTNPNIHLQNPTTTDPPSLPNPHRLKYGNLHQSLPQDPQMPPSLAATSSVISSSSASPPPSLKSLAMSSYS
eukprot:TRINITY_DN26484_c0_g1_i1.p1 TRINITY_DN26484_c0_g1~~TRINITY_DN26484_c0_g1_i1.p1  ORF type:complete len:116 (-),score=15.78 TRINITY_DN26484_c0_g1_i1:24-371(-)